MRTKYKSHGIRIRIRRWIRITRTPDLDQELNLSKSGSGSSCWIYKNPDLHQVLNLSKSESRTEIKSCRIRIHYNNPTEFRLSSKTEIRIKVRIRIPDPIRQPAASRLYLGLRTHSNWELWIQRSHLASSSLLPSRIGSCWIPYHITGTNCPRARSNWGGYRETK